MEAQDSIQVVIRVRPCQHDHLTNDFLAYSQRQIRLGRNTFAFDRIFGEQCQQQDIFNNVGVKLVAHSLEGYNSCIFAYGQTGSGKTHTMVGQGDGLIQRAVDQLFLRMAVREGQSAQGATDYAVTCSYFEIYNEQLVDLLDQSPKKLTVREDLKKGVFVENLSEETVESVQKALALLNQGIRSRHIGQTLMNRESSRSHAVYTLNIQCKLIANGNTSLRTSKLHFVDLAGSQRQKATACVGERLKEASNINKSLSTLGMVINSLSGDKQKTHIPFRDSKLTFVLRDSLGGNSKTFIIATISSLPESFQETLSTLKFAQRAKMVRLSAHINEQSLSVNVDFLKAEIRKLKQQLHRMRHELQEAKSAGGSSSTIPNPYTELIYESYNRGVSQMNEKINALLELLPTVTENPMFSQLTPECPQLLTYLTDNHELLSTIHDKLSSFCQLRQEIRAKASLEKLRLDDLYQTPSRKEQIEQFSNAKNRELSNAKQSMMELNNELLEKEARLQRMADEIEAVRRGARAQEEQNKYLREFYQAKQSQLLLRIQTQGTGPAATSSFSEEIQTLLQQNRHILEQSTSTISQLKNDLHVKSHQTDMLSKTVLSLRKANNLVSVQKQSLESQYKLLQMDFQVLKNDNAMLQQRIEVCMQGEGFRQKTVENVMKDKAEMEEKMKEELKEIRQQAELKVVEVEQRLEKANQTIADISSEVEILTETLEFKNNQITELEGQLRTKEQQMKSAQERQKQQTEAYNQTISQLQYAIEEARNILAKQVETWNFALNEENQKLLKATSEVENLTKQNYMLKEQLKKTWQLAEQSINEKNVLHQKMQKLDQDSKDQRLKQEQICNQLVKEIQSSRQSLQQTKQTVSSLTQQLILTQNSVRLMKQQLTRTKQDEIENEKRLRQIHSEQVLRLKGELLLAQQIFSSKQVAYNESITSKSNLIQSLNCRITGLEKNLQQQVSANNLQLAQHNQQSESLKSSISALEQSNANLVKQRKECSKTEESLRSNIQSLQSELSKLKSNCLALEESQNLKARLNEVVVANYKLRNRQVGPSQSPSRLEAKVSYYEQKFNLMKIQYNNSLETVRRLKQKEMQLKEENHSLTEKLRQAQMEMQMGTTDVEGKLRQENKELRAAMSHIQSHAHNSREHNVSAKQGTLSQQLQTLRKQKQTLISTVQLFRMRLSQMIRSSDITSQNIPSNDPNQDESKQLIKTLQHFEEMFKKKQGSLSKNIRKEEKLRTQNSFMVKENMWLKQRVRELQGDRIGGAGDPEKRIKKL